MWSAVLTRGALPVEYRFGVTTGTTVTEYFDVTHINAPISSFVADPAAAGPEITFTLVPVDEEAYPLATTVVFTWL